MPIKTPEQCKVLTSDMRTNIIEVLSPSTESYDRNEKFGHYTKLESLREYVLVSQERFLVERFIRTPENAWPVTRYVFPEEILELPSIACRVALHDIYAKVDVD